MQGGIDAFSNNSVFEGWARSLESSKALVVAIRVDEELVARAVAEHYRRDLLTAGVGHAHHAFHAKITRKLPAGEHRATLWDDETGVQIATPEPFVFRMSQDETTRTITCDAMLRPHESWDDQALCSKVGILNLDHNLKTMGYDRFIDILYLYIFRRKADDVSRLKYKNELVSGAASAESLFVSLLQSEERKQKSLQLLSPHDSRFPFVLQRNDADVIHRSIQNATPTTQIKKKRPLYKKIYRRIRKIFQ